MKKFWKIENLAGNDAAEIYLYGTISDETWWGDEVTPKEFAADLASLNGKDVIVRINSPGGDVFAAQAIHNQLKSYTGKVTAKIDGVAASAAVLVLCAAEQVIMPSNALIMIHNPAVGLLGSYDADELTKYAGYLTTVKQSIIGAYQRKVSIDSKKITKMMDAETWLTAQQAKEYGFADEIEDDVGLENAMINNNLLIVNSISCELKKFRNIGGLKKAMEGEKEMGETNESILVKIKNLLGIKEGEGDNAGEKQPQGQEELQKAINAALEQESQRLNALDALKDGTSVINEIINQAKKTKQSAEAVKVYVDAVKVATENEKGDKALESIKKLITDNMGSGAENIAAGGQQSKKTEQEEEIQLTNSLAQLINQKNGRVNNDRTH